MDHPPSLSPDIRRRAFVAGNGELGLQLRDVRGFLDACAADGIAVLGWEIWLADHAPDPATATPRPAPGSWCGLIPRPGGGPPEVIHGDGPLGAIRQHLATLDFDTLAAPEWRAHLRINFALGDERKVPSP